MKRLILLTLIALCLIPAGLTLADETCSPPANCRQEIRYGLSAEEIAAYDEPLLETLTVNTRLLYDRSYHQVNGALEIFDAPGGNITSTLDAGFNFLTILGSQDGWTQINPGQWVPSDKLTNTTHLASQFTGVFLPEEPLEYPQAWILYNLYASRRPGGNPDETRSIIWRYTRVNIYATEEVEGFNWYQIGADKWVHQHHLARITPVDRPEEVTTDLWISLDLYEQTLIAYEGDRPVFATLIASGLPRWPTNEGIYNIYFRRERKNMSGGLPGDDFYFLEEVPWTMFFDEGRALHGAYWHDGFGFRRSHGCVNLSITDAHWLYQWVAASMGSRSSADVEEGPAVYIYSSGEYL